MIATWLRPSAATSASWTCRSLAQHNAAGFHRRALQPPIPCRLSGVAANSSAAKLPQSGGRGGTASRQPAKRGKNQPQQQLLVRGSQFSKGKARRSGSTERLRIMVVNEQARQVGEPVHDINLNT